MAFVYILSDALIDITPCRITWEIVAPECRQSGGHFGKLCTRYVSSGASQLSLKPTVKIERQQWSET